MYYVIFTALGTFLNVVIAIAIDQCVFKKASKAMQTVMIIPVFISYAAVQFIVYAYLSTDTGILNNTFNIATRFYSTPKRMAVDPDDCKNVEQRWLRLRSLYVRSRWYRYFAL